MIQNDTFCEPMTILGVEDTRQGKLLHLSGDYHGNLYVDPVSDHALDFMRWCNVPNVNGLKGKRVVAVCDYQSRLLYYKPDPATLGIDVSSR